MNWKKVNSCEHEWTDYFETGRCSTPYCNWEELHCKKCKVYKIECGCGFENAMSGTPRHQYIKQEK